MRSILTPQSVTPSECVCVAAKSSQPRILIYVEVLSVFSLFDSVFYYPLHILDHLNILSDVKLLSPMAEGFALVEDMDLGVGDLDVAFLVLARRTGKR